MPDKYPLGLNINMGALRDWGALVTTCKMLNSKYHLVMIGASHNPRNDIDSVMRLYAEIGDPELTLIVRVYDGREGEWYKYNEDDYVNYCTEIAKYLPNVIFDAQANEPGVPPERREEFVQRELRLIRKFKAKGLRYAAMCFGVGSPAEGDVMAGYYDPILKEAEYISEHHYTMGWLEAGSGFGYDILLKPEELPQYWRTKWDIQPGHYLTRRSDYWALRCIQLGIRIPTVLLTELILDQIPDSVSQLNNRFNGAWDRMRMQYGLPEYNYDLRGLNTYPNYYKKVFPNLSYDEALAKIHIHLVEDCLHVGYIGGGMIFAWNQIWDIPMGTDASRPERRRFFELLSNHAKTYTRSTPPTPPVEPPQERDMLPITVTGYRESTQTANKVNIRATPSTSAAIVGTLPAYPVVTTGYVSDDEPVFSNGYSWQFYELSIADKTVSGYMAQEFVKEVEDVEQYYDFQLGALTFRWTLQERDDIVNVFNITAAILDNTEPRYAAYADDIRTFASAIGGIEGRP